MHISINLQLILYREKAVHGKGKERSRWPEGCSRGERRTSGIDPALNVEGISAPVSWSSLALEATFSALQLWVEG
jgi:hypothetical protein